MSLWRRPAIPLAMTCSLALVHCAWVVGFESSYFVDADAGSDAGSPVDPAPDGGADAARVGDAAADAGATFGAPIVLAQGEPTPFGGIAADSRNVYWTHGTLDGGVRAMDLDGGDVTTYAPARSGGSYQELFALPGDSVYWRVAETGCAATMGCGAETAGSFGFCGTRSRRLRTDGRRFYLLVQDTTFGRYPIQVISSGCASLTEVTRLDGQPDAAATAYVDIAPDRSGNRVFAVAGTSVDCLAVAGGAAVHVVDDAVLALASDDTSLYWLTPSAVHRCTLGSSTTCAACTDIETITATQVGTQPVLVLRDSSLYWLGPDNVSMLAVDAPAGTAETKLATGQAMPVALAASATGLVWANAGDGSIVYAPRR